jgi:hypothetical protein
MISKLDSGPPDHADRIAVEITSAGCIFIKYRPTFRVECCPLKSQDWETGPYVKQFAQVSVRYRSFDHVPAFGELNAS